MEYNVKNYSKKESVLHEKTTELSEVSDNQIFQTIQLLKETVVSESINVGQAYTQRCRKPAGLMLITRIYQI